MPKSGWRSSEFWATLLTHVAALIALVHPGFDIGQWVQPLAMLAAALVTAVYAHGRSKVKVAAMDRPPV